MSLPMSSPMLPSPYLIKRVQSENYDTFTLELASAHGTADFLFKPGQFNMLYMFGVGEVPISISGDPTKRKSLIHTIRAVGTVTEAMYKLKRQGMIGVRGPFGRHWPVEDAVGKDVVLVAGGIGLAPLRPVIYHLLSHRKNYGNISILYGARTPKDMIYRRELEKWRGKFDLKVEVSVDTASSDWLGNVGVVTRLISRAQFDGTNTVAMICGPEVMMRFTVMELQKHGVGADSIYVSLERNMQCAVGFCGHCQFGPTFICKDGPVFSYNHVQHLLGKREI